MAVQQTRSPSHLDVVTHSARAVGRPCMCELVSNQDVLGRSRPHQRLQTVVVLSRPHNAVVGHPSSQWVFVGSTGYYVQKLQQSKWGRSRGTVSEYVVVGRNGFWRDRNRTYAEMVELV